jgi:hypothetical protein
VRGAELRKTVHPHLCVERVAKEAVLCGAAFFVRTVIRGSGPAASDRTRLGVERVGARIGEHVRIATKITVPTAAGAKKHTVAAADASR